MQFRLPAIQPEMKPSQTESASRLGLRSRKTSVLNDGRSVVVHACELLITVSICLTHRRKTVQINKNCAVAWKPRDAACFSYAQ